ncbi:GNAT family N-acetyltransferase [Labrenzia sp. PHM005]|uniref:GNAT family N-acetyltransferase n=1 Tax=Labrenzia sp. PHM005 TaxID=2590016 RepID=UPI00113FEA21|nr:GNAT family N-acetyltransferase [Labrenzia sp. PHM005]QDG76893.1 GNAT family N-acetyltransferase [Labrenzia sp. PHM005]
MTIEFKIRKARLDEIEALTDLCMRSKQSNGYDDAFMAACAEEMTVQESWILEDDFWVLEASDGALAGCIRLETNQMERTGELATCFVDPDFQGKGVGRKLFESFITKAKDLDLKHIWLDADPSAEPFYARMGFVTTGRAPSGSIPGRTLPRMEMPLETANLEQTS